MNPQFSIIIPTFNRADLIPRAVNSVLNQTYQDFEIIIIDDASTDSTSKVVNQLGDERIKYTKLPDNRGPSAARNKGIEQAKGEFISLLDSDDAYLPGFLQATIKALKNSTDEIGFSWTGTTYISTKNTEELKHKQIFKRLWTPHYENKDKAYRDCLSWDPVWGTGHGVTIKSSVFKNVGLLDEDLRAREDIDLLIRLVKKYKFKVIPKYLVNIYNDSSIRVDSNYLNKALAYINIYNKHKATICENSEAYSFFNKTIAENFSRAGYHLKSIKYLLKILNRKEQRKGTLKNVSISLLRAISSLITKNRSN